MPGSFQQFSEVAESIRLAKGKLEKTRLLADLLRSLPSPDLYWAALYFTGAVFAPGSGRVAQVGFAAIQAAAQAITGCGGEAFAAEYLRWSDLGDTLSALYGDRSASGELSLAAVAERLGELAAIAAGPLKADKLATLFSLLGPPEARYLAKILTGELRIGLKEGLVEDAIAQAFSVAPAEVRKSHQLSGDLGAVAVAARDGALEALQVALFTPIRPMLATPEPSLETITARLGTELWIEDKYDGIRAQAHRTDDRVALFSRDLKDVSQQFPEVLDALRQLPGDLILDGELLAHRDGTARPFFDLQKRLGRKELTASMLTGVPVAFFAFDLLYEGQPLLDHPFRERRARLEALPPIPGLYVSPLRVRPAEELETEFSLAKSRANEGLMLKAPDSPYTPGRRGMSWIKYKKTLEPLDVVVTGVELGHGRRREVLSDYTFAVRDEATGTLVNIGKAYSGLTDAEILELTSYFQERTLQTFGRYRQVQPQLVIEVAFEAIQKSARHKSGYALRFPRIVRLRPEKSPADINTLEDVRRAYETCRSGYDQPAEDEAADTN